MHKKGNFCVSFYFISLLKVKRGVLNLQIPSVKMLNSKGNSVSDKKISFGALPYNLEHSLYYQIKSNDLWNLHKSGNDMLLIEPSRRFVSDNYAQDCIKFAEIFKNGLHSITLPKGYDKIKFISIGQSPAVLAETLGIMGLDTAIFPISKLAKLNDKQLKAIAKSESFQNYIKTYLANKDTFGLNLTAIQPHTKYIFCDYTVSGSSLKNFEKLLEFAGLKNNNFQFIDMETILEKGTKCNSDIAFVRKFLADNIQTATQKKLYSPIFTLDALSFLNKLHIDLKPNPLFNKLKTLMIDLLRKKIKNI